MVMYLWFLVPGLCLAIYISFLLIRRGGTPSLSLRHPLAPWLANRLPRSARRLSGRFYWLMAALLAMVIAGGGIQYGTKFLADHFESRFLAILIDVSGSISQEQKKHFEDATGDFFTKFRDGATVSIIPFADWASPSPLFTLSRERDFNYAFFYLKHYQEIDVGGGTEGGRALFTAFERLMVPEKFSLQEIDGEIYSMLRLRQVKSHEEALKKKCYVADRAVIMFTDADFYEDQLASPEVIALYRLCGLRLYLMSVEGKDPEYLIKAVSTTGKFVAVSAAVVRDPRQFSQVLREFYSDILALELSKRAVLQRAEPLSYSWMPALLALFCGFGWGLSTRLSSRPRPDKIQGGKS